MMVALSLVIIAMNLVALGAIAVLREERAKAVSVAAAGLSAVLSVLMIVQFIQHGNQAAALYIPYLNVGLSFGLTGISAILLLMSEIILLVTAVSGNTEQKNQRASAVMVTLFQISAVGLFTSMDLLLFFIFWDVGVVALFLMINVLGSARRRTASMNFILYELFASSMLLLGILLLYVYSPAHSLSIQYLASAAAGLPTNVQIAVLVSLFLAFITNMAVFPLHFWLPDAYAEASTQGSMLLSGILTKFGGYGMLILFSVSALAHDYSVYMAALGIVSAVYAALLLVRQRDLKRIVAYAGMVEMGIILVAIASSNSVGTAGAVYGMLSQGLSIALAFLAIGVISRVFDERNIDRLRGILDGARSASLSFALSALSMIGFPLTSGFVAGLLIFFGAAQAFGAYGLISLAAVLVMGGFFYVVMTNCLLSKNKQSKGSGSATMSERLGLYALSGAIIVFGLMPFLIVGLLGL
jgi:proton-translocating NADH-quinone oxidoreductase chain M